jgi:hypothetical protein
VGDSNSIPQLTLSVSADSARQQAAAVEVLEQLAAYKEETVQYTVTVEGLEQNITNTNSNTTTNTDEIDMELQLGVILSNILVSSTPVPTPHEVVSEHIGTMQYLNSVGAQNLDQPRTPQNETPAFLVQLNIADPLDQPDTTTSLEGSIPVQTRDLELGQSAGVESGNNTLKDHQRLPAEGGFRC